MYSIKCPYYKKKFNTINELVEDIIKCGMDPNYEITKDNKKTGDNVIDFIHF
jgi:hypothetical protein